LNQTKSNLPEEAPTLSIRGVDLWESWLSPLKQRQILEDIRAIVTKAPLLEPVTPIGKKMSIRMTSAERLGWVTDKSGYGYEPNHPDGTNWPPIPQSILEVWEMLSGSVRISDCT
jgi:alkylated DNA repair protein (DNA oxidative demethylase)